jgi:transposase-like protein
MVPNRSEGGSAVEVDETYVGGRRRFSRRGRPGEGPHNQAVLGVVQRGGQVAAVTVDNVKRATVLPIVQERILPRSTVYTDHYRIYRPCRRWVTHMRASTTLSVST